MSQKTEADNQSVDIANENSVEDKFVPLRHVLMGWDPDPVSEDKFSFKREH